MHSRGLDMGLTKGKLGHYIEIRDNRNSDLHYNADYARGVNTSKQMMQTKADLNNRDLSMFQIVAPGEFFFNHRTSRNGSKFSITYNDTDNDIICTEDYVVFRISEYGMKYLALEWLYMFFNRPEFDRYVITNSWGSSTEFYNWEDLCDVDIDLPPLSVQQKYVDIYNSMVANQRCYERGLEDLKLVCDAYIEDLRRKSSCERLEDYIKRYDVRNGKNGTKNVMGVSTSKQFRPPTSKVNKEELANYKVCNPRQIAFVQTTHNEKVFTYAFNNTDEDIVVSSVNEVFSTDEKRLLPEYLCMFFNRAEFDRYARFHSWGSARETFTWQDLICVEIPIPDISTQKAIAELFTVYNKRKQINERLKAQIKDICPVLVKGAVEEGKKE